MKGMALTLPDELTRKPFTVAEAERAGLARRQLRSAALQRLYRGVYADRRLEISGAMRVRAAILAAGPRGVAASNVTGLALHGVGSIDDARIHLATHRRVHRTEPGIVVHRHYFLGEFSRIAGCAVLSPERCLVDAATHLSIARLVAAAEGLIALRKITREALQRFAEEHHFDGIQRLRRSVGFIRPGSESYRETFVRIMLEMAGLPAPSINPVVGEQSFVARLDLAYEDLKIAIEYDGRQHGLSLAQRERDVRRREELERDGWKVIVITAAQLAHPRDIVHRVHQAMVARGYRGRAPEFTSEWRRTFMSVSS